MPEVGGEQDDPHTAGIEVVSEPVGSARASIAVGDDHVPIDAGLGEHVPGGGQILEGVVQLCTYQPDGSLAVIQPAEVMTPPRRRVRSEGRRAADRSR
jgi:hypothetical protein